MNKKELLTTYRTKVLELSELRSQLNRAGTDGRPGGCRTMPWEQRSQGTNNPHAAAMQLMEGLETLTSRKEAELQKLAVPMNNLLDSITDCRTYLIVQHYYMHAMTDEQISRMMYISRTRANQIRLDYFKAL